MPFWQWSPFVWGQYIHIGFVSFTVMVNVVGDGVSVDGFGVKPEKTPPARG